MSAGANEDGAGLGVLVRATRRTTSRVYGGPSRRPALPPTGALQPQVPTLGNGEGSPTVAPSSPVLTAAKPRRRNSLRSCRGRAWGCSGVRDSPARVFRKAAFSPECQGQPLSEAQTSHGEAEARPRAACGGQTPPGLRDDRVPSGEGWGQYQTAFLRDATSMPPSHVAFSLRAPDTAVTEGVSVTSLL